MLAHGVIACSTYSNSQIPYQSKAISAPSGSPRNRQATAPCTAAYSHRRRHVVCQKMVLSAAAARAGPSSDQNLPEKPPQEGSAKKGTILGAVSLIVGTSIGSGILALPQKTSPAGFIPSAACTILCWVFLVVEALLLAELNTDLRKKRKKDEGKGPDLEVISLRTMAQETLDDWGGNLATVTYLFLGYTSAVAYTSISGEVLSHLISLPSSILGNLFTLLLAMLILVGGINITDQVNQWLTVTMIGLLVMIEFLAVSSGGGSVSLISNWDKAPQTIPVIIFSLVYHDISPVICAYLGSDLRRIRLSILLGSIVPLITLLVWEGIALGISSFDGNDPLESPMSGTWRSMSAMVETFSILAVGTSLIGTLFGFSQFFVEQLVSSYDSLQEEDPEIADDGTGDHTEEEKARNWWEKNKPALLATSIVIFPSMFISSLVSDAFSIATDIAGGYCMIVLYGILPPAMAWSRACTFEEDRDDNDAEGRLSRAMPVLVGVGLFSCAVIVEQVVQDLTHAHSS